MSVVDLNISKLMLSFDAIIKILFGWFGLEKLSVVQQTLYKRYYRITHCSRVLCSTLNWFVGYPVVRTEQQSVDY